MESFKDNFKLPSEKSKTNFRLYAEHAGERGTYSRFRVNWKATGPA